MTDVRDVKIGSKVVMVPDTNAYRKAPPQVRESIGVVYARSNANGKFIVRFQEANDLTVILFGRDLKVLGTIDDPQEVKRLAISWGANRFDRVFEVEPYV